MLQYSLNDDEYMITADFKNEIELRNVVLESGAAFNVNGKTYKPKYSECKDGFIELSSQHNISVQQKYNKTGKITFYIFIVFLICFCYNLYIRVVREQHGGI